MRITMTKNQKKFSQANVYGVEEPNLIILDTHASLSMKFKNEYLGPILGQKTGEGVEAVFNTQYLTSRIIFYMLETIAHLSSQV